MKKVLIFTALLFAAMSLSGQDFSAKSVTREAEKQETIEESISYLKSVVGKISSPAEKRAVYIFMASMQEQMSLYSDAQKSYVLAAGIGAGDVEGMVKKSNEQLVLDAVRCALSSGDAATADSYLNSAVRNSKNPDIQAHIKLYTQWSALCKADSVSDLQEPVVMLQAYEKVDSMISIQPSVLLTLWYITGEKSYSDKILKKFPGSVEASIVKGDVQLLPTPFWFFVPKSGEAEQGTGSFEGSDSASDSLAKGGDGDVQSVKKAAVKESEKSSGNKAGISSDAGGASGGVAKLQLGLFRTESNAKALSDELNKKGFKAYVSSEKRSSGTVYYLVLVNDEKSGAMADRLRSSGYECYVVE